jgi:hypothetical protein
MISVMSSRAAADIQDAGVTRDLVANPALSNRTTQSNETMGVG